MGSYGEMIVENVKKALNPDHIQWSNQMPLTKVRGFLTQFPWVRNFVPDNLAQVFVSKVDESTLLVRTSENYTDRRVWLLDERGNLVSFEGMKTLTQTRFLFFETKREKWCREVGRLHSGESVGEALDRLGTASAGVRYVLWYNSNQSQHSGRSGHYRIVVLFKAPQGVTMKDWIAQQSEKWAGAYAEYASAIDAEAVAQ